MHACMQQLESVHESYRLLRIVAEILEEGKLRAADTKVKKKLLLRDELYPFLCDTVLYHPTQVTVIYAVKSI